MAALPGPHAFLFVLNPTTRITEEELKMLNSVREIFGTASINHTIIIFTHSDSLDAHGITIQEHLAQFESNHPLNKLLDQCGHRYLAVNNRATNTEKTATVRALLDIVAQMVANNNGQVYINANFEAAAKFSGKYTSENQDYS
ncbi:unnamed protein product [Rotaria sp. Silwood2]|nr:unnamed protein product [Rotaria sp. Silwood2]CAF4656356.1 unnamed protein product [Rotaria sp. Silwood2]